MRLIQHIDEDIEIKPGSGGRAFAIIVTIVFISVMVITRCSPRTQLEIDKDNTEAAFKALEEFK
jgi:hypothetical protein